MLTLTQPISIIEDSTYPPNKEFSKEPANVQSRKSGACKVTFHALLWPLHAHSLVISGKVYSRTWVLIIQDASQVSEDAEDVLLSRYEIVQKSLELKMLPPNQGR